MIKLEKYEKVILVARKHWFILVLEVFSLVFLILLPLSLVLAYRLFDMQEYVSLEGSILHLFIFFSAAWMLFIWIAFFVIWTDYYLDIMILTNIRIIDIEQKGLFSRDVSTLQLERIQDINVKVHGVIPTLLKFGDVQIQTASVEREFIIEGVPHPYDIKDAILSHYNTTVRRANAPAHEL